MNQNLLDSSLVFTITKSPSDDSSGRSGLEMFPSRSILPKLKWAQKIRESEEEEARLWMLMDLGEKGAGMILRGKYPV